MGSDDFGVDPVLQQTEQDVVVADRGAQLVLGQSVERIAVPFDLGDGAQAFGGAVRDRLRDEDASAHRKPCASAHPAHDSGDTVDGNLHAVGNALCDIQHAQDHRRQHAQQ